MTKLARETVAELETGHAFLVLLRNALPINVLSQIRAVPDVCSIYCATANTVQVVVAETDQGRASLKSSTEFAPAGLRPKRISRHGERCFEGSATSSDRTCPR